MPKLVVRDGLPNRWTKVRVGSSPTVFVGSSSDSKLDDDPFLFPVRVSRLPLHHRLEPRAPGIPEHEAVVAAEPIRPGLRDAIHNLHPQPAPCCGRCNIEMNHRRRSRDIRVLIAQVAVLGLGLLFLPRFRLLALVIIVGVMGVGVGVLL